MTLYIACCTIHLSWCNLQVSHKLSVEAILWNATALYGRSPFTIARRYLLQLTSSSNTCKCFRWLGKKMHVSRFVITHTNWDNECSWELIICLYIVIEGPWTHLFHDWFLEFDPGTDVCHGPSINSMSISLGYSIKSLPSYAIVICRWKINENVLLW